MGYGEGFSGTVGQRNEALGAFMQDDWRNFGEYSGQIELGTIRRAPTGGGYVWFDPTTMSIPGPSQLGTCGISTERGPAIKQVDTSLTDVFPGGGINKSEYGANAAYVASVPTGVVNTSLGARNLVFALKYRF